MSGGEESRIRIRSLDGWSYCEISGCQWRVSDGPRCREHGGSPAAEIRTDEWGATETHVDHVPFVWKPWD